MRKREEVQAMLWTAAALTGGRRLDTEARGNEKDVTANLWIRLNRYPTMTCRARPPEPSTPKQLRPNDKSLGLKHSE